MHIILYAISEKHVYTYNVTNLPTYVYIYIYCDWQLVALSQTTCQFEAIPICIVESRTSGNPPNSNIIDHHPIDYGFPEFPNMVILHCQVYLPKGICH